MALKIGEVAERSGVNLQTIPTTNAKSFSRNRRAFRGATGMFPKQTVRRVRFTKRYGGGCLVAT